MSSRLFTTLQPGQRPLNARQRNDVQNAQNLKKKILETGKRFKRLDNRKADQARDKDTILVGEETKLPKTVGNQMAKLAFGMLAPSQEKATVKGYASVKDGEVKSLDVTTTSKNSGTQEYRYSKESDGTEVFHGPNADGGFMMVRENKAQGTLFVATDSEPMHRSFGSVSRADFQPPASSEEAPPPPRAEVTAPTTLVQEAPAPRSFIKSSASVAATTESQPVTNNSRVSVKMGDITQMPADTLIAPINTGGLWWGGIDGAIQKSAGDQFHGQARAKLGSAQDGQTVTTQQKQAHNGKFGDVVFVFDDGNKPLDQIVKAGLEAAQKAGKKSVSLPAMRMGVARGSVEKSPEETVAAQAKGIKDFFAAGGDMDVTVAVYRDQETAALMNKHLN